MPKGFPLAVGPHGSQGQHGVDGLLLPPCSGQLQTVLDYGAVAPFHHAAAGGQTFRTGAGIVQLSLPVLQVSGQPVQKMPRVSSRQDQAFSHHYSYIPLVNEARLLLYSCLGSVALRQRRRPFMQVLQKVIAVQQEALFGKDRRHLLRNPGRPVSHAMHPGVVPIPAPQRQGEHLLSRSLGRTQRRSVPPFLSSRLLHYAQPRFPSPGFPDALGTPARTHSSCRVQLQLPGAHHAAIGFHYQTRLSKPAAPLPFVAGDGLPVLLLHEPGGSFRLLQHRLSDAAAVQFHSVVFLELPAGLLK